MTAYALAAAPPPRRLAPLATIALLLGAELGVATWLDGRQHELQQRIAHLEAVIDRAQEYRASILPQHRS